MIDIYFDENYGKLYKNIENGKSKIFELECKNGKIVNQFIKREIPIKIDDNKYYDIVTPYGYGGPLVEYVSGSKNELIEEYEKEFSKHCEKNNIIAEFVRFHPIIENALDFKEMYNAKNIRNTLGTNLEKYENPVEIEFSKSCRKSIRQALRKGINYKVTKSPENIDIFKKIYYSTMDRNNALEYYYFGDEYFDNILKYFKENILLVEAIYNQETIACGLYFVYNKIIHIHLSGTLTEYLYLSPAYILRYAVTLWGKENGYKLIHHGGGRLNSKEDNLYLFKKQFAKNTEFDFYVGQKVWNKKIYKELVKKRKEIEDNINPDFFPLYRS